MYFTIISILRLCLSLSLALPLDGLENMGRDGLILLGPLPKCMHSIQSVPRLLTAPFHRTPIRQEPWSTQSSTTDRRSGSSEAPSTIKPVSTRPPHPQCAHAPVPCIHVLCDRSPAGAAAPPGRRALGVSFPACRLIEGHSLGHTRGRPIRAFTHI